MNNMRTQEQNVKLGVAVPLANNNFTWEAFTEVEQLVFRVLYEGNVALKAIQIYSRVAVRLANKQHTGGMRNFISAIKKEDLKMKEVRALRKKGAIFPSYPTIYRILEDFTMLNWVGKREGSVKRHVVHYYLPEEIRATLTKKFAVNKK